MTLVKLPDREEFGLTELEWFLYEELTMSCPVCGTWTEAVRTGPSNTDYIHKLGPEGAQCTLPNHAVPNFLHNAYNTLALQRKVRAVYIDPWEGHTGPNTEQGEN